ncbi:HpcH/HpaI aldolase/citrate lyase family protein [Nocardioides caeni]|uniref:ATP/GTP-binding protein n=1 Tax=Nocardioides caeni TaxID=574700 RepID=A0A4S8NQU5_9ACTN|nr:HpcH/HpaI aldolase/citrate lyase family protein [Nocardioides caeni]THV18701.1 ATP/GTP-binding protein [Nocardioides caeni]
MRHFAYLTDEDRDRLFEVAPQEITPDSPRHAMALALGATIYMPATRPDLVADSHRVAAAGATSTVWCLEDAIEHDAVATAEAQVVAALSAVTALPDAERARLPLVFVRVRDAAQIRRLAAMAGPALSALTGFSLPKSEVQRVAAMLAAVREVSKGRVRPLYAMPILESEEIAYVETRRPALRRLAELFTAYDEHVLCVRVGGTDLSGLFGLRRDRDTTIWDVAVVRDVLADILNQFTRNGDRVVTGAVWEHIPGPRMFKPQLRATPFDEQHASSLRRKLIARDVDGLMRETNLDKTNGMYGKTVIHPAHISVVNSMLTVNRDEYDDAREIVARRGRGGVAASAHGRMNEIGPHSHWAEQLLARAAVYGVLAEDAALVDLLSLGQRAAKRTFDLGKQPVRVVS